MSISGSTVCQVDIENQRDDSLSSGHNSADENQRFDSLPDSDDKDLEQQTKHQVKRIARNRKAATSENFQKTLK